MIATYRLQLQPGFGFSEVRALLPYFKLLGVSHLYCSPITDARLGSTHGYDVIDHNQIREELGGRKAFEDLLQAVEEAGLELLLDFVPNHAGVTPRNLYWQDMLAYGPHSPNARFFDVDWNPLKSELQGKILLPFLGSPYGDAVDRGEIKLIFLDGRIYASYYDDRWALNPATYAELLEFGLTRFERTDRYWDLRDLVDAYRNVQPHERDKSETLRPRLNIVAQQIDFDEVLADLPVNVVHRVLEQQFWRLSYWKTAGAEINYRRFFDINGLVGLRMEDPHVFWDSHRLLAELLPRKGICGIRIDHIDGLFDPHHYLEALRDLGATNVWVEKILAAGETLPDDWPVMGTSGYEFLNDVMALLLQPNGELPLDRIYRRFVPEALGYDQTVLASKNVVMNTTLSSELYRLAYELDRISEADYHTRDFTLGAIRESLEAVIAAFDRYRTYLPHQADDARQVLSEALARAKRNNPAAESSVFQYVFDTIMGHVPDDLKEDAAAWVGRFQQYTAPVAAKGVEDTAFYRYYRLVALNEVGGEPARFGQTAQAFHSRARFRSMRYPRNLLATATHDHKRGEDTRMRLIALAEVTELWDQTLTGLEEIARKYRQDRGPSRSDEYLFYQHLAALWVDSDHGQLEGRLTGYLLKAARESKLETSWLNQNEAYESALTDFVHAFLADDQLDSTIRTLAERIADLGFHNSVSQMLIKFTTPGVPDIYQGCELPDLSMVDPDNRRDVDYSYRLHLLESQHGLISQPQKEALDHLFASQRAEAKFFVTARLLQLRNALPHVFQGAYRALEITGDQAEYWFAFAREAEDDAAITLVSRFSATLQAPYVGSVALPEYLSDRTWINALTGDVLEADDHLDLSRMDSGWAVWVTAKSAF